MSFWKKIIELLKKVLDKIIEFINRITGRCVPKYNPGAWNVGRTQCCNNCYNYACNKITDNFAQPGYAAGEMYTSIDCLEVSRGARADGLVEIDCDTECSGCQHKVALVIQPDLTWPDFHWYRQDKNGMWSHKPGKTEATNLDNSGNPISNPRTADRGAYTEFCGCFCIRKLSVEIAGTMTEEDCEFYTSYYCD